MKYSRASSLQGPAHCQGPGAPPGAPIFPPQQGADQLAWERIGRLAGVKSVGAIDNLPLTGIHGRGAFTIEGHPTTSDNDAPSAYRCTVSVNYFQTMGVPLLQGREFTERDREGAPTVVMVNESVARRYWPGQNPLAVPT